jgi:hypothetical protein
MMGTIKATLCICIASIVALAALRSTSNGARFFVLNRTYHIVNLAVATVATSALLTAGAVWAARLRLALAAGLTLSRRRARACGCTALRGAGTIVACAAAAASHAFVLADPRALCKPRAVAWLGVLQLTGWNVLLVALMFYIHCLLPRAQEGRADGAVVDEPMHYHWPKLLLVGAVAGAKHTDTALAP